MFLQRKNKLGSKSAACSRAHTGLPEHGGAPPATLLFHRKSSAPTLLWPVTAAALLGCANPGPPKPPTLHLPEPAKRLAAERVANQVVLTWETSADTTDGQTLKGPISAQICRNDAPRAPSPTPIFPPPPDPCKVVHEETVEPSTQAAPTQLVDELPAKLTTGEPRLVAYRVTLLNGKGRSAGPSAPVYAVAGAAPAAVGPIDVSPERNGALIRWRPANQPPAAPMQLTRTLLENAAGTLEPKKAKVSGKLASQPAAPLDVAKSPTVQQITLRAEGESRSDRGGMIDHGIHDGDSVRYVAQRVLTVRLTPAPTIIAGKRGKSNETKPVEQAFELKSEPSPPVTFVFHDVIPPPAPTGLAAVTGGGFGEAPSIDLSWEPNAELDIAGYNVYRAGPDSRVEKVNGELVMGPEFRDTAVQPGTTYVYRVTAVDQHHNESSPSATVKAEVRR